MKYTPFPPSSSLFFFLFSFFSLMFLNGCSLSFDKNETKNVSSSPPTPLSQAEKNNLSRATFAGGCFWCSESDFQKHDGVTEVISGYIGEEELNITYTTVSAGKTKSREGIQVLYNPEEISYPQLLKIYWKHIDPTDNGGQFSDRGSHYTTAIFYHTPEQKVLAEQSKKSLQNSKKFQKPIVTEILPFPVFVTAEEYHQDYFLKNEEAYHQYREGSGRNDFVEEVWEEEASLKPSDTNLKKSLTDLQYHVTQEDGTERPFDNPYWDMKEAGIYVDIVSEKPLYSSLDKYKSGTGWPSFTKPLVAENILEKKDTSLAFTRTEIRGLHSDSHLGHVFPDGPTSTGLRYCMNSAALRFVPVADLEEEGYGEFLEMFVEGE